MVFFPNMPKCFASKILAISSERHIKVYYISLPLYRWENGALL